MAGADEDVIDTDENVVDPQLSAKLHTGSSVRDMPESTSAEKSSAGKGTGSGQGAIPKKKKMTKKSGGKYQSVSAPSVAANPEPIEKTAE